MLSVLRNINFWFSLVFGIASASMSSATTYCGIPSGRYCSNTPEIRPLEFEFKWERVANSIQLQGVLGNLELETPLVMDGNEVQIGSQFVRASCSPLRGLRIKINNREKLNISEETLSIHSTPASSSRGSSHSQLQLSVTDQSYGSPESETVTLVECPIEKTAKPIVLEPKK